MPSASSRSLFLSSAQPSALDPLTTTQIAAVLLEQDTVIDCVVRCLSAEVSSAQETAQFLAYVVLSAAFDHMRWQSRLREMFVE